MTNITEIIKKLRKYEARIRKYVNAQNHGSFASLFRGVGLEFDDVRQYQYGDDVRSISWNVSAKGHGVFVKTYKEEKEQTVFFLLDVSASQKIGKLKQQKLDVANEICSVLMLSAIRDQSKVGLALFSDEREYYMKPSKGNAKAYEAIKQIFTRKYKSTKTDLNKAIRFVLGINKRRSLVVLISDFIDSDINKSLTNLSKQHDLVCIHLKDDAEDQIPRLGIIPVTDVEHGKTAWINTSASGFKGSLGTGLSKNVEELKDLARRNRFDFLSLNTKEDFVPQLIKLFRTRNKVKKKI